MPGEKSLMRLPWPSSLVGDHCVHCCRTHVPQSLVSNMSPSFSCTSRGPSAKSFARVCSGSAGSSLAQ
jgi:hypothetical protein